MTLCGHCSHPGRLLCIWERETQMYLIYLDESGNPNGWTNQDHFVIGGVAVHEGQVQRLSDRLDAVQSEFFPNIYVPLNFHAVDIRSGNGRRFRRMVRDVREDLLEAVYDAILDIPYPGVVPFATAIHISAVVSAEQALRDTFEDVLRRVNAFLAQSDRADPQYGLLVIDRSQFTESRYPALLSEIRRTAPERVDRIVDVPYFSQSSDTRLLQAADFCAHAVFRHYERGDGHFLDRIMPRSNSDGSDSPRDGLRYITQMP